MTGSITSMRHAILANCALALVATSPALSQSDASAATSPEGHWRVADGSAVIRFERCGEDLCGRIVQLRENPAARDEANPIRALRDRPICGIAIFTRLRPGRDGRWTGGRLYDPESGHTLTGVSVQRRGERVEVSIGSGPFAGSEAWPTASAPARACGGA